jgi:hypothetical protein
MRIDHEYSTDKTSMVDVAGLVCSHIVGHSTDVYLLPGGCVGGKSNICHGMIFLSYDFQTITGTSLGMRFIFARFCFNTT